MSALTVTLKHGDHKGVSWAIRWDMLRSVDSRAGFVNPYNGKILKGPLGEIASIKLRSV